VGEIVRESITGEWNMMPFQVGKVSQTETHNTIDGGSLLLKIETPTNLVGLYLTSNDFAQFLSMMQEIDREKIITAARKMA
jgi:hypothetical protein